MTTRAKNRLALVMDCSVHTIERWISDNEDNGSLTKTKAVQIIGEETGLPEADILEESEVESQK
jgi:hypothetical protein